MIRVTSDLAIDEREIREQFVRSPGPGGQNVNKVATAVQLRFDAAHSPSLPENVRARLMRLAGGRLSREGVVCIRADRFRTRERNRRDALERLVELVRAAAREPRPRRATRPSLRAERRRLEAKRHRGGVKRLRGMVQGPEE